MNTTSKMNTISKMNLNDEDDYKNDLKNNEKTQKGR